MNDEEQSAESEEVCYALGNVAKTGDPANLSELLKRAAQLGVVRYDKDRHELWYVEGGGRVYFPVGGWGFTTKGFAWICYLGMGGPPVAEIRFVVNPRRESEKVFSSLGREMMGEDMAEALQAAAPGVDMSNVRTLRVINGGKSDAGTGDAVPATAGGDEGQVPVVSGESESDVPTGEMEAREGD